MRWIAGSHRSVGQNDRPISWARVGTFGWISSTSATHSALDLKLFGNTMLVVQRYTKVSHFHSGSEGIEKLRLAKMSMPSSLAVAIPPHTTGDVSYKSDMTISARLTSPSVTFPLACWVPHLQHDINRELAQVQFCDAGRKESYRGLRNGF